MFRLLRYFSIASLVSMLLAAILLGILHQLFEKQQLLRFGESRNIMLARVFSNSIWPQYQSLAKAGKTLDAAALRGRPEVARLSRSLREAMRGSPTVGVSVYLLNGRTLFSSDTAQIGVTDSNDPAFLAARLGQPSSQIVNDDKSGLFGGKLAGRDVLSSYLPVRGGEDEPIEAVIEDIYRCHRAAGRRGQGGTPADPERGRGAGGALRHPVLHRQARRPDHPEPVRAATTHRTEPAPHRPPTTR